jgi:ectoine hydroxylase-related dioxygenase (phytanoyl-CoA dioxygenase family)
MPDSLDSIYPITEGMASEFDRDGYILLRDVFPATELEPYREAIRDAALAEAARLKPMEERDTYGKAFIQAMNVWRQSEMARRFVFAKRFARIAAELMGVSGVRLYHDQALFKEPGGGPTPWHQDQFYWPLDGFKTVTMWMPLVYVPAEMMAMKFAVGSHHQGPLKMVEISDDSDVHFSRYIHAQKWPVHQIQEMAPGDATFHCGWNLHGAPGNRTDRMREVMTIIYFEDGAVISEPDSDFRRADLAAWFPGLQPGEVAASDLNPLLYSAE